MRILFIGIWLCALMRGGDLLRKLTLGQADFIVEPKHIIITAICLTVLLVGGAIVLSDNEARHD